MSPLPASPLSRRDFLAGGLGAAGLALFATACSGGSKRVINVPNPTQTTSPSGTGSGSGDLNIGVISALTVSGINERLAFVLRDKDQGFITPSGPVTFAMGPDDKHLTTLPIDVHSDAPNAPVYLSLRHTFPNPGFVVVQIEANGKTAEAGLQVVAPASEPSPIAGRAIPSLATPTTADLHGIDPAMLCTRTPPCPLHDLSLDVALKAGKPIALLFATPKFCQTATCGPTLDVLLGQRPLFDGKAQFLHLEIYPKAPDFSSGADPTTTYVVDAFKISSEPILLLVGPDGKVRERIDGLVGAAEVKAALDRLTGAAS